MIMGITLAYEFHFLISKKNLIIEIDIFPMSRCMIRLKSFTFLKIKLENNLISNLIKFPKFNEI